MSIDILASQISIPWSLNPWFKPSAMTSPSSGSSVAALAAESFTIFIAPPQVGLCHLAPCVEGPKSGESVETLLVSVLKGFSRPRVPCSIAANPWVTGRGTGCLLSSAAAMAARRAQFSKRNRLTVGYLAGWAAPNGGPLDAMDSAQAAAAIRYIYTRRGLRRFILCSAHRW